MEAVTAGCSVRGPDHSFADDRRSVQFSLFAEPADRYSARAGAPPVAGKKCDHIDRAIAVHLTDRGPEQTVPSPVRVIPQDRIQATRLAGGKTKHTQARACTAIERTQSFTL